MLSAINRSLRYKVMAVILTATLAALLVSTIALLTYEVREYRAQLVTDIRTQAGILARMNSPALTFDDAETARANLALLDTRRDILSAAIYTVDGEPFASYAREGHSADFGAAGLEEPRIGGGTLTLSMPIVEEGNRLGTLHIRARADLTSRLYDYLLIVGGVLIASLLVAALVSLVLQRSVTRPIQAIADVARKVIRQRDFTLRAPRTTDDEIGVLVEAFNGMLAEVGEHQHALEESNRKLLVETDERRNAEAALRAADRRKDEFLATLAHELRNPLAPMVNSLSLVRSGRVNGSTVERAHAIIERQLTHMVRLVEDLLDVSRITRGRLELRKQRTDLGAAVQAAVDTVQPLVDGRGQELTLSLPPRPIYIDADAMRLSQVFSNLLNNAAKYTPEGGHLALALRVEGAAAHVEFSDDGAGIAQDELDMIFEMFSQAESADKSQPGLGVGLALAKRLVELHGGRIEVASEGHGRGSRFTVVLPAVAAEIEPAAEREPPEEPTTATRPLRILLVDDNVDFATSLEILLRELGHDVRIAHNASEAMKRARETTFDVAFLDIGLPIVDGYELAQRLRRISNHTALVALSGWGQDKDRQRSNEAGFALHMVKPVELSRICAVLTRLAPARTQ